MVEPIDPCRPLGYNPLPSEDSKKFAQRVSLASTGQQQAVGAVHAKITPVSDIPVPKPVDHVAEARGSKIVEHEGQADSGRSNESSSDSSALKDHFPNFSEGIYSASSDSIVFPETGVKDTVPEKEAAEVMSRASDILDREQMPFHYERDLEPNDNISIKFGDRVIVKGMPADSLFKDGEYVAGESVHGRINIPSLGLDSVKAVDGDIWYSESKIWLDGAWRTFAEYEAMNNAFIEGSTEDEHDAVNHPSHYTAYPGIEIIQLTRRMSFNRGNAVKYIARAGLKDPNKEIEDLEKARFYIEDEIRLLKGEFD